MDRDQNTLEIVPDEKYYVNREINCAYYQNHYYNLCISELSTMELALTQEDSTDTFYFQHVHNETINDINHYLRVLEPLVHVLRSNMFTVDQIAEGEAAVKQLGYMITNGPPS